MKDELLKRSKTAAQKAIRNYLGSALDQFYLQAAICIELAMKSVLAEIHESLVVDNHFDSLLNVCGGGKFAKDPPWRIKTIGAAEALKRCSQIEPRLSDFKHLRLLADLRNSVVHLGAADPTFGSEIFKDFVAASSLLANLLGIDNPSFFGEFSDLIETHLNKTLEETHRTVAAKIAKAKTVFGEKYGRLDHQSRATVFSLIEQRSEQELTNIGKYEAALLECPACGEQGIAWGDYKVDWEPDDYDIESGMPQSAYAVVTLHPRAFNCLYCGLELGTSAELKAAGIDTPIDIRDVDDSDFIDEPEFR